MPRKKKDVSIENAVPKKRGRPKKVVVPVQETPVESLVPEIAVKKGTGDIAGPEIRDGFVHLSRTDLLEFELRQSKVLTYSTQKRLLRYEHDEVRRAQDRAAAAVETRFRLESEEYLSYKTALSVAYEVDFDVATYDDVTGRILIEGVPLASD